MLYQKMLTSFGVSWVLFDMQKPITSIRIPNDALYCAVSRKPFTGAVYG